MPGQKNQSAGQIRNQRLPIRLTKGEKAMIEEAAAKRRLSMANFISHEVIPTCEKILGMTIEQFERKRHLRSPKQ